MNTKERLSSTWIKGEERSSFLVYDLTRQDTWELAKQKVSVGNTRIRQTLESEKHMLVVKRKEKPREKNQEHFSNPP